MVHICTDCCQVKLSLIIISWISRQDPVACMLRGLWAGMEQAKAETKRLGLARIVAEGLKFSRHA